MFYFVSFSILIAYFTIHSTQIYILVHNQKWKCFCMFSIVGLCHSSLKLLEFDKLHISFCIKKFKLKRSWKEKVVWSSQSQLILFTIHQHCICINYHSFSQLTFKEKKTLLIYLWRMIYIIFPITLRSPKPQEIVLLESPWWVGVHQVGFIIFWPTMEKLLNIEQFSQ